MSLRFSGEQEKCGRNVYEFSAFNPGVGVCQTYSNFPINSSSYTKQLNLCIPFPGTSVVKENRN